VRNARRVGEADLLAKRSHPDSSEPFTKGRSKFIKIETIMYRVRQKELRDLGHSFGWGARRRTAVYVPFSLYTMAWSGEHRAFIVEELIKNGGSPVVSGGRRVRQI